MELPLNYREQRLADIRVSHELVTALRDSATYAGRDAAVWLLNQERERLVRLYWTAMRAR